MGAKAESRSQTLGRAQGVVMRRERKKQRTQRSQKQQENKAHRTKWPGLMGVCRDQGICKECALGLLHICYDWEAWCSCETWQWQRGLCLTIFPPIVLPCPMVMWWYVPGLFLTWYSCLVDVSGRPAFFFEESQTGGCGMELGKKGDRGINWKKRRDRNSVSM